ncbi:hypothetical protein, partial [Accumulibacter sp.]|uniref:hypothetical protein n=1 Tax=Accumulibacter sp. TaxID=2053492 RepID=UPI0025E47BFA
MPCSRIEQLLNPQALLVARPCTEAIERAARRDHAQLVARVPAVGAAAMGPVGSAAGEPGPP